ncbi:membrane protein [Rhodococcus sp. P27]|nr:membrane protein [Rhodococcus sp. P27]
MLHLRVICPTERTEQVLGALASQRGATHIVVLRDVAVHPAGDMVEADVAREAANDVVDALTALGVAEDGGMTLVPVETVLSAAARKAERDVPGDPADSVVWEELLSRTREESTLNGLFVAFLTIACLLAAIGVVTDSQITIVGAMVVGPEFGPLAALAVALVRRDRRLRRRSILALAFGFPIAMGVTLAATFVVKFFGWMDVVSLESLHEVDFVYKVGPISFVVALLAGAAGMLALVSSKSAALVGVFISVTTVPAAGFAVVAAANGEWRIAGLSSLQLAVNLVGIVTACVLVLWVRTRADEEFEAALKGISRFVDEDKTP